MKNHSTAKASAINASLLLALISSALAAGVDPNPSPEYRSPADELKTMVLPPGYKLQLVASEPMIKEPVTIAWDGNGRMFVAQMETYMQDADGTKENEATSRVMMLTDTDGDGTMDKASVFIDKLVLPRLLLPLDGRLLVAETYSDQIHSYRDTNNDGVADEKILVYQGGAIKARGNLEHQDSGLVWNLDNWIYTSMSWQRLRFSRGVMEADACQKEFAQWGLTQDDMGRMYYSSAGMEQPAFGFQIMRGYGKVGLKDELAPGFMEPWPLIATPDVQGGPGKLRPDKTLNHFTGSCGQSVFRGDNLPKDLYGDLLICEPVGRLIRRAKANNAGGKIVLSNAYDKEKKEFITSTDRNFRPIQTATGPDGCLYIVDMYRGIIQEGNWVKGYLRDRILEAGLEKNVGRGRIWRLVSNETKKLPAPKMLNETAMQLGYHLSHPNGWWRDTAQKLLVLKRDPAVVAPIKQLARTGKEPLGRMHALWTLEGMDVIDAGLLTEKLHDSDPRVRIAALRISERLLRQGDNTMLTKIADLAKDKDPNVVAQVALTASFSRNKEDASALIQKIEDTKVAPDLLAAYKKNGIDRLNGVKESKLTRGGEIYASLCTSCHGPDGKGLDSGPGKLAPPLAGAAISNGEKNTMIKVVLRGLTGPIEGKTYLGQIMVPMAQESDQWIADVLTEVRSSWGNKGDVVTPDDVAKVRKATKNVMEPYTMETLMK